MAAAPPLPKQRRWLFLNTIFPCARTGLTGHSGPPTPPTVRKNKGKTKEKRRRLANQPIRKDKGKVHSRAGLGSPPLRCRPPPRPLGVLLTSSPTRYASAFAISACTAMYSAVWGRSRMSRHIPPSVAALTRLRARFVVVAYTWYKACFQGSPLVWFCAASLLAAVGNEG